MKIILPFNVTSSKIENGKLIKYFAKAGEEIEVNEDELPFYKDLQAERELAFFEEASKKDREVELKKTLEIRKITDAMRFCRLNK